MPRCPRGCWRTLCKGRFLRWAPASPETREPGQDRPPQLQEQPWDRLRRELVDGLCCLLDLNLPGSHQPTPTTSGGDTRGRCLSLACEGEQQRELKLTLGPEMLKQNRNEAAQSKTNARREVASLQSTRVSTAGKAPGAPLTPPKDQLQAAKAPETPFFCLNHRDFQPLPGKPAPLSLSPPRAPPFRWGRGRSAHPRPHFGASPMIGPAGVIGGGRRALAKGAWRHHGDLLHLPSPPPGFALLSPPS